MSDGTIGTINFIIPVDGELIPSVTAPPPLDTLICIGSVESKDELSNMYVNPRYKLNTGLLSVAVIPGPVNLYPFVELAVFTVYNKVGEGEE